MKRSRCRLRQSALALAVACGGGLAVVSMQAQGARETVKVIPATTERTVALPGELQPFEAVGVVARVDGYLESVTVDRGSDVRRGQVLATLVAPELAAQVAGAEARVEAAVSGKAEADADVASARLTFERLSSASQTTGAVAGLELRRAEESMKASEARVSSAERAIDAARAARDAVQALQGFLRVTAPFAGRVTERLAHPGALVGPAAGPLLRLEQVSRLRLTVAVPEQYAGTIARGRSLEFRVPSHGARVFTGTVARVAGSLDARTRSMPVELDVDNADGALAPGMFAEVTWPVTSAAGAVLVPTTAIVTTTERIFVIRARGGKAEWVTVKKVAAHGDTTEVTGGLAPGDTVLKRGSDEVREGTPIP
ncbi:MAG TPA: efflux RND transporter periplasmic adaptor subunit [Vicinamibacterales bacterium]|nr:efflux RND transporter periplasmic adaptor subunit [Vicinamibacterales bacterium]